MKYSNFALVDCNNFYASCEQIFQPRLRKRPVVVLGNNDGIVVARSAEAKELDVAMGQPYFEIRRPQRNLVKYECFCICLTIFVMFVCF